MITVAEAFQQGIVYFRSIDALSQEVKDISVQHARDILEKLRLLASEDSDAEKRDLDEERKETSLMLLETVRALFGRLEEITQGNAALLDDEEFAGVIGKAIHVGGVSMYKTRLIMIEQLIKQGKTEEAAAKRTELELATPQAFKMDIPLTDMVAILEAGLSYAELLQKKIASGMEIPPWQNTPPPPPKKKEKDAKAKAADLMTSGSGMGYKVMGVSKKGLVASAQQVNEKVPDPLLTAVSYKVVGVSKEELVASAQKANETQAPQIDPLTGARKR